MMANTMLPLRTVVMLWASLLLLGAYPVSTAELPEWIESSIHPDYPEHRYILGVGFIESAQNKPEDWDAAFSNALSKIAQQISVEVTSHISQTTTAVTSGNNSNLDAFTQSSTEVSELMSNLRLQGVTRAKSYYDGKDKICYVLAVLDKRVTSQALQNAIDDKKAGIRALYSASENNQKAFRYYRLLQDYQQILEAHTQINKWNDILRVINTSSFGLESDAIQIKPYESIVSSLRQILNQITIEIHGGDRQSTRPGGSIGNALVVRVTCNEAGTERTVEGMPIAFQFVAGKGELEGKSVTDAQGLSGCKVHSLGPTDNSVYRIAARLDLLSSVDEHNASYPVWERLVTDAQKEVFFNLTATIEKLEDTIVILVEKLMTDMETAGILSPDTTLSVTVGNINYQETKVGSQFIQYFKDRFEMELSTHRELQVINQSRLQDAIRTESVNFKGRQNPGSPASVGAMAGARIVITGKYWNRDDAIDMLIYAIDSRTGETVATARIVIENHLIPATLHFIPDNYTGMAVNATPASVQGQTASGVQSGPGDTRLDAFLWVDKGDGGIYDEGSEMRVYFRATQECYIRLIVQDVDGRIVQLYPNKYRTDEKIFSNHTYTVPDIGDAFAFRAVAPFGAEVLTLFASSEPIPQMDGRMMNNGILLLNDSTDKIRQTVKSISMIKKNALFAEATCTVTTIQSVKGVTR